MVRNRYFRQLDLLLCTLYSVKTIHTNSAVYVVIEVIHQFVQNNNFVPYVINQLSHMHIYTHTHIRLSENLPLVPDDTCRRVVYLLTLLNMSINTIKKILNI